MMLKAISDEASKAASPAAAAAIYTSVPVSTPKGAGHAHTPPVGDAAGQDVQQVRAWYGDQGGGGGKTRSVICQALVRRRQLRLAADEPVADARWPKIGCGPGRS